LRYADDHVGWIVTRHHAAQEVLSDARFSQQPWRMPAGSLEAEPIELDDEAVEALRVANLLGLDGEQHTRLRRSITSRFTVKAARGRREAVSAIVREQLAVLRSQPTPANLTEHFAQPISARVHCLVLGIPDRFADQFTVLFVGESSVQEKFDFLRAVLEAKRTDRGEDVLSDLLGSDLSTAEIEGLTLVLMTSGRDSVAYMIATTTVALLTHPEQLALLRADPTLMPGAIEEFMRFGAMFITLFPRTATEEVVVDGVTIHAGQSVSVSSVAGNRDERRFPNPEEFDVTRDAYGHLGFGHGLHGCVGQQLARIEITEAITQLIGGIPSLRLVHAEQSEPMPFAHPVATYEAGAVLVGWD
jgi:cytochrome P450